MHVVRCFEDPDIIRHADSLNPQHDIETINLELIAADRETVAKRAERAVKMLKSGEKRFADEAALGEKLLAHLDNLQPARTCPMTDKEREIVREWFLLTTKPVIYACNIKEDDLGKDEDSIPGVTDVKAIAAAKTPKCWSFLRRSKKISRRWTTKRRTCSSKRWASARAVWIA